MKNELGRKITSLTIMTIMIAGGMTFAAPGMMPVAAAENQLLYVSAENAMFANTFSGGQIVEIIVRDPNRSDTEVQESAPEVEVNGDTVRMIQADDGYWYAYIADTAGIVTAAASTINLTYGTAMTKGHNLTSNIPGEADVASGTAGITISAGATVYYGVDYIGGEPAMSAYGGTSQTSGGVNIAGVDRGVNDNQWPFIQSFDFSAGPAEIVLEKAGADETVLLDYDNQEDFASISMDRSSAPKGSELHLTITDGQLNVDPTADETVLFYILSGSEGVSLGSATVYDTVNLGFGDNGVLKINKNTNSAATAVLLTEVTADDVTADDYLVFLETGANTGIFVNTDDSDDSNLDVHSSAARHMTATIDYNDSPVSFIVSTSGATIDMDESSVGDEWNSGESMTVTITDEDLNLNTAAENNITVASTEIPTIVTGSPASAGSDTSRTFTVTITAGVNYTDGSINKMIIPTGIVFADLPSDTTLDLLHVDVTSLGSAATGTTGNVNFVNSTNNFLQHAASTTAHVASLEVWSVDEALSGDYEIIIDYMSFGDGQANAVYRMLLEETGDNTGVYAGSAEYLMLNQLTADTIVVGDLTVMSQDIIMILASDLTGSDAPRIKYMDTDADGQQTPVADQADANTHNGVVSFDSDNYKVADTVTVTVTDMDLNTDSDLIDVYTVYDSSTTDADNADAVGDSSGTQVLTISIGGEQWDDDCDVTITGDNEFGLFASGFLLAETDTASGIFTGTFQIPSNYCNSTPASESTTGQDLTADYIDFLDASGNQIEVGAAATITANSGSVSLDRQVYPVPWAAGDFKDHADVNVSGNGGSAGTGSIIVTISIADEDYNTSPVGEDTIPAAQLVLKAYRGSYSAVVTTSSDLVETTADSGVFETEVTIPATFTINSVVLKQGDILTAEYTDPTDASGNSYLNTDSSTLDLRTASLTSDKSVYVTGSDAILSINDADLNLDSGTVESYVLNLINWDSDAADVNLGAETEFDPEPSKFRETGENTGVFQVVIEIPDKITVGAAAAVNLDSGEKIDLEYVDHGTAGEDNYSTTSTEDIGLTIYTSNFGATIELDKKVYTWTDRVFVNITAPDHNTDTGLVEEIGGDSTLTAQTRSDKLTNYKLVETGPDTGIFWGEITLVGFAKDADGDATTGNAGGVTGNEGPVFTSPNTAAGPTDGYLEATDKDGITISFEFSEDQTVVSSSLVRWNIAEIAFDEDAYLANSSATVNVSDIDMNLNNDAIENFTVELWSDSDSGGVDLTVTETSEASGEFSGVVFFTTTDASSGHTLRVSEGDSITASYDDNTLPEPYSNTDELEVTSVAVIGTIIPPLERAPASNLRTVDAFGGDVNVVSIDQQVQLQANIANGSDGEQPFAYLVQVQNDIGVTVSLAWITGTLSGGQSFSPALSWIPTESGSYTATAFVWESISNPTALSASISTTITVE